MHRRTAYKWFLLLIIFRPCCFRKPTCLCVCVYICVYFGGRFWWHSPIIIHLNIWDNRWPWIHPHIDMEIEELGDSLGCFHEYSFILLQPWLSCGTQDLCCYSVAQSCPALCDPMDCSTPGLPVHHQLPELTQTHVH